MSRGLGDVYKRQLLVLPALLILCDGVICKTTHGMRHLSGMKKQEVSL